MKPLVRRGKIVGFKAFDKKGIPLPVLGLRIEGANPNFSCYFCRCIKGRCECVPVVCASGPRTHKKRPKKKEKGEIITFHPSIILNSEK